MRVSFLLMLMLPIFVIAQDVLIKRDGKEVKTRILSIEKKQIIFKLIDDPEFQTVTIDKKDVRMIRMESGKVYNFDVELPSGYIGIGGGAFIPTGKFASSRSGEGYTPGYATLGSTIKISAGFYIKKKIGIPVEFKINRSKYSVDGQLNNLDSPDPKVAKLRLESSDYDLKSIQTGLMYSSYLGSKRKTILDLKALVGMTFIGKRESEMLYTDSLDVELLRTTTSYNGKGFLSYGFGANFRYLLSPRIGINVFADFLMATPEINYNRVTQDFTGYNNNLGGVGSSMVRSISGVSTGLSLYYHFKRRNI